MRSQRTSLGKDEDGFTLPEVLVTIMMMIMVLFALYSIFDMGIRVFAFGNDKVEAVENARLGLERMQREIRAAYPVDAASDETHLFFEANGANSNPPPPLSMPSTSPQITFGNELGSPGDREITCPASPTSANPCEYITYKLSGSTLVRNATADGSTSNAGDEPMIESVNPGGLSFEYLDGNGSLITSGDQADIDRVRITLDVRVEGRQDATQTLATEVDLRNQGVTAGPSAPPSEPPPPPPPSDTTPPVVMIDSGPSGTVTSPDATFTFSANETATFECRIDGGAWATCTSPRSYTGLSSGSHTFEVRATDTAGNQSATVSRTWTVSPPADTTPPVVTITSGPSGTVTSSSATFSFSANEPATFECRLDGGAWTSCSSPRSYSGLSAGSHTFSVRATDAAGNQSSAVSRTWNIAAANRPPVANNDSASVRQGNTVTINVLANDTDPDGDSLTVTRVGWIRNGNLELNTTEKGATVQISNNRVVYTPRNGAPGRGEDRFYYEISDGRGGTAIATVTVDVRQ